MLVVQSVVKTSEHYTLFFSDATDESVAVVISH